MAAQSTISLLKWFCFENSRLVKSRSRVMPSLAASLAAYPPGAVADGHRGHRRTEEWRAGASHGS